MIYTEIINSLFNFLSGTIWDIINITIHRNCYVNYPVAPEIAILKRAEALKAFLPSFFYSLTRKEVQPK